MDTTYELYLLKIYMYEYIDRMAPVTLDYQVRTFSKRGYIDEGHNGKNFPSFEQWKKIREMFGKPCFEFTEIQAHDLIFIPRRSYFEDVFKLGSVPVSFHSFGFLQ